MKKEPEKTEYGGNTVYKKKMQSVVAAMLIGASIATQALSDPLSWQERRLLKPTTHQLAAERRGQVMIYDQMDSSVVDAALDSQFDRMEHMMFIRVQHRAPDGTVDEDDDC